MARVSEAGAVVVRLDGRTPRYLLITAKKNPDHWLFPKGHVEEGESPREAALRELHEEGGVRGRVLGRLGSIEFEHEGRTLDVEFFLIEYRDQEPSTEPRKSGWYSYEDALGRLTFEDTRRLLRTSQPVIAKLLGRVRDRPAKR